MSILATASKSSLMFVAGECIAQLRWVSFQTSRQPLSYVQMYDSASRGPWGSLTILVKDKCRSLVAIGAFIVLLAMAFDPFIQQIIEYPVLPTQRQSMAAKFVQSRYLLPGANIDNGINDAINAGIWTNTTKLDVSCPTGNCTWPHFRSVEMCSKCVGVDPSNVTLSWLNPDSLSYSLNQTQRMEARISVLDTIFSNLSIVVQPVNMSIQFTLEVPTYISWMASLLFDYDANFLSNQKALTDLFGFDHPLVAVASAKFDLPEKFSSNQSHFQSNLIDKIKVSGVNVCALAICAREYAITVQDGDSSIRIVDEDFGSMYTGYYMDDSELCWRPSPSPTKNRSTNSWSVHEGSYDGLLLMTDPANFEFCGVEPAAYYDELADCTGDISLRYFMSNCPDSAEDYSSEYVTVWDSENKSVNVPQSLGRFSFTVQRVASIGIRDIMANIASSVSELARKMSDVPIYGVATTQDSYVAVRWQWLALPAALLVAGCLLLVVTALTSSRKGVRIWKSSILPLLFHGMEPEFVARNMMIEHGQCESVSEMEQVADGIRVDFGLSNEGGRTMLRGAVPPSQNAVGLKRAVSRRRSF